MNDQKATFFKALADPARLAILTLLLKKDACICELAPALKKDQSVTFRHCLILEKQGLITTTKEGKRLTCRIPDKRSVRRLLEMAP